MQTNNTGDHQVQQRTYHTPAQQALRRPRLSPGRSFTALSEKISIPGRFSTRFLYISLGRLGRNCDLRILEDRQAEDTSSILTLLRAADATGVLLPVSEGRTPIYDTQPERQLVESRTHKTPPRPPTTSSTSPLQCLQQPTHLFLKLKPPVPQHLLATSTMQHRRSS